MVYYYRVRNALGRLCGAVGDLFEWCSLRLRVCEECGRSRYFGESCRGGH